MAENEENSLAQLPLEIRRELHLSLYRQECRAWLLALGLLFLTNLSSAIPSDSWKTSTQWFTGCVSVFLAFWVVYPSQMILGKLRKIAAPEDKDLERKFDASWQSLWDFGPPLLLPLGYVLVVVISELLRAVK